MGLIQDGDVTSLLRDEALMNQVAAGLVEDTDTMDTLADDIAGKVQDAMDDDPELRQRIISAAISNEAFKKRLVHKLISELS